MSFARFWENYPRKVAKKDAEIAWRRLSEEQHDRAIDALPKHIRVWQMEGRDNSIIPHAATWLNGERFSDELSIPGPVLTAWWQNDQATMAHGRTLKIPARPGEDMAAYRQRLMTAERSAA